jgi:hypothetical protein
MKKVFSISLSLLFFFNAQSQVMQAAPVWSTISIPQLKCWECKQRLEDFLSQEKGPNGDAGIIKWIVSLPQATLRIQYFPDRITLAYIKTEIANDGFDADTVRADSMAYRSLPPICKRKEEGGGQKKGAPPCSLPPDERGTAALPKP